MATCLLCTSLTGTWMPGQPMVGDGAGRVMERPGGDIRDHPDNHPSRHINALSHSDMTTRSGMPDAMVQARWVSGNCPWTAKKEAGSAPH